MSSGEHTERGEDTPHNTVFSRWSPEELDEMCDRAARAVCRENGYCGEREDIEQELLLYLWEHGHVVRHPEYKGAIVNFLKKVTRDVLRRMRRHDRRHTSLDSADPGRGELPDNNETAEKMLRGIGVHELLAKVLQDARGDQLKRMKRKKIIEGLLDGATQQEIAASCDVSQSQVSRLVTTLRRRLGLPAQVAGISGRTKEKK